MPTVLVAEDEPDIRESFAEILDYSGYDVFQAADGDAAYELACREHPDIILLDVMMPGMDGFQVLAKLRENPDTANTPVVMLTAISPLQGEQKAFHLGVEHYLTKPCDPESLELTIRVALREAGVVAKDNDDAEVETVDRQRDSDSEAGQRPTSYLDNCEEEAPRTVIGTGNMLELLEKTLGSGIPIGSLTLVEGASGAGKSVLCQHLTYGALVDGHGAVYFTSDEAGRGIANQMKSIGLDVSEYRQADKLRIHRLRDPVTDQDPERLFGELTGELTSIGSAYDFIVVDAITNLVTRSQDKTVIDFFSTCKRLCFEGKTIILVSQPGGTDSQSKTRWRSPMVESGGGQDSGIRKVVRVDREVLFTRLRGLSDTVINLRSDLVASRSMKVMEVRKGNTDDLSLDKLVSFVVEAGVGMRLMPVSRTRSMGSGS